MHFQKMAEQRGAAEQKSFGRLPEKAFIKDSLENTFEYLF